jgi:CubicO group peptidase (beta-lactamase class C family)
MNYKITFVFLLFFPFLFGQENLQKIDSLLNSLYAKERINGNVLIAEKGKIIYNKSFGWANETTQEKLNENSIFDLASVSKQFTAMGVMILKEQGKLKLEDPISQYLPELSFYKGITIRHLLHHTSGLPEYMEFFEKSFDKTKIATNQDILEFLSKEKPKPLFEPNSQWEYSNTGYAVLASLIERISGKTCAEFLSETIFEPLNMKNTFVYNKRLSSRNIENFAFGYVYSDEFQKFMLPDDLVEYDYVKYLDGIVGDGAIHSTVMDLWKWDRALYSSQLISSEGLKEIFAPTILADGSNFDYGMGWELNASDKFGKRVFHSGGWPGYMTFMERHLDHDRTIITLMNHDDSEMIHKPIRYFLYNLPIPNPSNKKEIHLTEEQLTRVLGVYEIEKGMEFKISLKAGEPYAQMTQQPSLRIYPESEFSFFLKEFEASLLFETNEKGEVNKLILIQGEHRMEAKKIQ